MAVADSDLHSNVTVGLSLPSTPSVESMQPYVIDSPDQNSLSQLI